MDKPVMPKIEMRNAAPEPKQPVINCHTHIFTGHHVPPFLARSIAPWPLYLLINLRWVVNFFKWWYNRGPGNWPYRPWYKKWARKKYNLKMFLTRHPILNIVKIAFVLMLTLYALFILWHWFTLIVEPEASPLTDAMHIAREWLEKHNLLYPIRSLGLEIMVIVIVFLFIPAGRNFIFSVFKKAWAFLGAIPGKQAKELFMRYVNIGRFAFHERQNTVFSKLKGQYVKGTAFVILPMDMEYMEAGGLKKGFLYRDQMNELAQLKNNHPDILYPFVFADPRRMADEADFFSYDVVDGKPVWNDCFVKTFIEQEKFSGFKIYPALGYYPFDEQLLPLWKYAADHELPITTHCIRGVIYYRGAKKKEWDQHPYFEQWMGSEKRDAEDTSDTKPSDDYRPLLLPEVQNNMFSVNFTHPLNYLCLLHEPLLRKVVADAGEKVQQLFGFNGPGKPMNSNLSNLKICFGHFGGDDEWHRFFEKDRDNFSRQMLSNPENGINFFFNARGEPIPGKMEQMWKGADWYSIISSMILQYPNIYADISYILHNDAAILPLLRQTLNQQHSNPNKQQLRDRVLYGTDFYVVRNHKSDKNMLADMMGGLSGNEFDQVARINPRRFLYNNLHGPVNI